MLNLSKPKTRLYPLTQEKLQEFKQPMLERLQKWRMFCANNRLEITDFYGKPVSYSGIAFTGSPECVFWAGHFEPFMIDTAKRLFQWVIDHCAHQRLDAALYLGEARELLKLLVKKTYREMADTDRVLRGNGYPESVRLKEVEHKITHMQSLIDDLLLAMTHTGSMRNEPHEAIAQIFKLEPSFYGVGINLRSLWSWLKRSFRG